MVMGCGEEYWISKILSNDRLERKEWKIVALTSTTDSVQ